MAFGSFFKKIITGAKNIIGKVIPVVKKGLAAVSKIAPAVAAGASMLGGPIGATIGSVANTVGSVAGGISNFLDQPKNLMLKGNPPNRVLGANGAGVRRFDVPLLK